MKNFIRAIFCFGLIALLYSCQENESITSINEETILSSDQLFPRSDEGMEYSALGSEYSKTEARAIFSRTLALSIQQFPSLKDYLMEKASEQFNGDTEVLYAMVKDDEIEGMSLNQMLLETAMSSETQVNDDFFSTEVIKADPYITIYVDEIYFENQELASLPVYVGYETAEVDDTEAEFYWAYTNEGEPIQVTEYGEDAMLIGVKENERLMFVETTSWKTVNKFAFSNFISFLCPALKAWIAALTYEVFIEGKTYKIVNLIFVSTLYDELCTDDNGGGGDPVDTDGDGIPDSDDDCPNEVGPASNNGCPLCVEPNCDRTNNPGLKDKIHNFKFVSCSAFSSTGELFEGKREMRAAFTISPSGATPIVINKAGVYSKGSLRSANWRGKCKSTKWVNAGWETLDWDYCKHGEQAKIVWIEKDGGPIMTITATFKFKLGPIDSNVTAVIPIGNKDDVLGESLIQYCDQATGGQSNYNTGSISFNYGL